MDNFKAMTRETMEKLQKDMIILKEGKLDKSEYAHQAFMMQTNLNELREDLVTAKADAETCCNYLEKYAPVYAQRQLTHVLGYVFPQKDVTWRLNWYNEVRFPLLTAGILQDGGKHQLRRRMQEVLDIVTDNPLATMEQRLPHKEDGGEGE